MHAFNKNYVLLNFINISYKLLQNFSNNNSYNIVLLFTDLVATSIIMEREIKFTRLQIFEFWHQTTGLSANKYDRVCSNVFEIIGAEKYAEDVVNDWKQNLYLLCNEINRRWTKSGRIKNNFLSKYSTWLHKEVIITLPAPPTPLEAAGEVAELPRPSTSRAGRPAKDYKLSSDRSKRRKTSELIKNISTPEITHAAKMKLRSTGQHTAAKLVEEAIETTPTRAIKIREAWKRKGTSPIPFSADRALSLLVDCKSSRKTYEIHRMFAKANRANIYPPYYKVQAAKKACYPNAEGIIITEKLAEVKIQALLDHTISRIVELQEDVIKTLDAQYLQNIILIVKWGFDGSSGHSEYKQRYKEEAEHKDDKVQEVELAEESCSTPSDADIFITSLVPIQMVAEHSFSSGKIIIWQNPRPSSPRYCRPIRIQFAKETVALSKNEEKYIQEQVDCLQPFVKTTEAYSIKVTSKLILTMVDGKVCNSVMDNKSSQKCYLCGLTPKFMNNIDEAVKAKVDKTAVNFGLSTLHAWIRFFEYFLHVSYRLDIKAWKVLGLDKKNNFMTRKQKIQYEFQNKMGLKVDKVKSGGAGTSNDGNTARRFFSNPSLSAEITGIKKDLIYRCSVILSAISSGYKVNIEKFDMYAKETARRLIQEYPWYYLPASIHKILIHGAQVIDAAILPIGQLSEEAQEARNKDLKYYREKHTRKMSREATMTDLLNALLVSSDPIITSMRPMPRKSSLRISKDALDLLEEPEISGPSECIDAEYIDTESESTGESDDDDFEYQD